MTKTVAERIEALVREQGGFAPNDPPIGADTRWDSADLGFDSLDRLELVMSIEDAFEIIIPDGDVDNPANATFGGLVAYVEAQLVQADA